MIARNKQVSTWPGQHRTNWYTSGQTFRHGHNIGYHVIVFPAEKFSRAAHACLHFIADHHEVLLITPLAHTLNKFLIARPDAALSLHSLKQHTYRFLARSCLQCLQVVIWHLLETIRDRYPGCLVGGLPCGSSCCQGAPVETALHTDNFIGSIVMYSPKLACQFDSTLICLCPAIGKE